METKSEMIRARVTPSLKKDAEMVLKRLGLTPTDAITLYYQQVVLHKGLPFDLRIPEQRANNNQPRSLLKGTLESLKQAFE